MGRRRRAAPWAACACSSGASAQPDRVARAVVLAVGAAASADQIALCSLQVRAIRTDPAFHGGDYYETPGRPVDGLLTARGIGHFTYRTGAEFEQRFGREPQGEEEPLKGGRYAVESYLQYQGEKLAKRFDPNCYVIAQRGDEPPRRGPGPGRHRRGARRGAGRRDRGRHHDGSALPAGASRRSWPGSSRAGRRSRSSSPSQATTGSCSKSSSSVHRPGRAGGRS